jgi:hypothetical protein
MTDDEIVERVYLAVQPEGEASGDIIIWLVNEADEEIHYRVRTGEFASLDDDVLESSVAERDAQSIQARSAVMFERDDIYGFDFVVWWHVDLVDRDGVAHPMAATRGKYGWWNPDTYKQIPFTGKRGVLLRMRPRGR